MQLDIFLSLLIEPWSYRCVAFPFLVIRSQGRQVPIVANPHLRFDLLMECHSRPSFPSPSICHYIWNAQFFSLLLSLFQKNIDIIIESFFLKFINNIVALCHSELCLPKRQLKGVRIYIYLDNKKKLKIKQNAQASTDQTKLMLDDICFVHHLSKPTSSDLRWNISKKNKRIE